MPPKWIPLAAAVLLLTGACGGDSELPPDDDGVVLPTLTAGPSPTPADPTPTVVVRREPTATPTPEPDALAPVESKVLPGIPVPYAAVLMTFELAFGPTDALAVYAVADTDAATLRQWYSEQMPAMGWGAGEDRDGALVFIHETEQPARQSEAEQPRRAATLVFADGQVTILAEEPG